MSNNKTHQRVCAKIPIPLYLHLKNHASKMYNFKKGYTQEAINHSIDTWVWMMGIDPEIFDALREIGENEYSHIKDKRERHKKMMTDAVLEYIEKHKQD
jgi:hypothetical protein